MIVFQTNSYYDNLVEHDETLPDFYWNDCSTIDVDIWNSALEDILTDATFYDYIYLKSVVETVEDLRELCIRDQYGRLKVLG